MIIIMKRVLALVLIAIPFLLSGCFQIKDISYTDQSAIDISAGNDGGKQKEDNSKSQFVFNFGEVSYDSDIVDIGTARTGGKVKENSGSGSQEDSAVTARIVFKSIEDFDEYIQELKTQSDIIMQVIEQPRYTSEEINQAMKKNDDLLEIVRKVQIPKDIVKTEEGRYYANKYAKEELEAIIDFRNELLDNMKKSMKKMTKELNYKIKSLQDGAIPIKVSAFNTSRTGMMEKEGYVWDKASGKFVTGK